MCLVLLRRVLLRPLDTYRILKPPTIPAPPIPKDGIPRSEENAPSSRPSKGSTTHFSTVRSEVRSGAIRIDITDLNNGRLERLQSSGIKRQRST